MKSNLSSYLQNDDEAFCGCQGEEKCCGEGGGRRTSVLKNRKALIRSEQVTQLDAPGRKIDQPDTQQDQSNCRHKNNNQIKPGGVK